MLPTEYGLNAYSPEAFAAIAVEDLLRKTGKDALHTTGAPSNEYLGMLALYALRRSVLLFSDEKESFGTSGWNPAVSNGPGRKGKPER